MEWWEIVVRLVSSVVIGCIIGIEREKRHRPAGIRTHVLVCVGAAIVAVTEALMTYEAMEMGSAAVAVSRGRLMAQVISGIGFLGAGTIFMQKKKITGLTTAASLWCVGGLGLAVGAGFYILAGVGCFVVLLTLSLLQHIVAPSEMKQIEITFVDQINTKVHIKRCFADANIHVMDVDMTMKKKGHDHIYVNLYTVDVPIRAEYDKFIAQLMSLDDIQSVRTVQEHN